MDRHRPRKPDRILGPVLCLLPPDAELEAEQPLIEFLTGRPGLTLLRERRRADRRVAGGRRHQTRTSCRRESRLVRSRSGRRIGERRAQLLPFRVPAVSVPGDGSGLYRLLVFAQRVPQPAAELERLEAGWLVTAAQAGEPGAFERLHGLYADRIARFMKGGLRDPERVEDAAQEVFFRALRALPGLDSSTAHFGHWLFGIARNHLIDLGRAQHRLTLFDSGEPGVPRELYESDARRDHATFIEMIDPLPISQQQVLFLRYAVDLSWADIALLLGRSSGAVRMLQLRAHETLRQLQPAASLQAG